MTGTIPDEALRGLEGRARRSLCATRCKPDCRHTCHESHVPDEARAHDPYYCDQIRLGRDVTEYRRDFRIARSPRALSGGTA
jgi:hypothetical protein